MIRVDIETIIMASGPVPSLIVLRERAGAPNADAPLRSLSIQTGSFEAASISRGIDGAESPRPITHDLFLETLSKFGVKLERIEINRYDAPIFFADLVLMREEEEGLHEVRIDARPSDALALAVRSNAPIFIEDDVMNRAGTVSLRGQKQPSSEDELQEFDQFVQTLSPDDF